MHSESRKFFFRKVEKKRKNNDKNVDNNNKKTRTHIYSMKNKSKEPSSKVDLCIILYNAVIVVTHFEHDCK